MTKEVGSLAIIGSGATAIFLLKHICDYSNELKNKIQSITIFERASIMGMGMPYSPVTTDIYNLSNISSEEIPELPETFGDWLRKQDSNLLASLGIREFPIADTKVYGRLALGAYLQSQYQTLLLQLKQKGFSIIERNRCDIVDIEFIKKTEMVLLSDRNGFRYESSKVIIATGHQWRDDDRPEEGYFASPWPIQKLLPKKGDQHDFTIGTLGASLSAFDVVTSLAHRHGTFKVTPSGLTYFPNNEAPNFKIVLHSAEGWLPNLQYEQVHPLRNIYRHTTRQQVLALRDQKGFLRIEVFFDHVCRPALIEAFTLDAKHEIVNYLGDPQFGFKDFIQLMSEKHEYTDSFEGMRKEMVAAIDSVTNKHPIHWKETLDDLMYCLNFHAELMPAEDHLFFQKEVRAFLMNVIAALPLPSAAILLALYDSGNIEFLTGKVTVLKDASASGRTRIELEGKSGEIHCRAYQMFVNCAGQKNLELEDYPFQSLVQSGVVRKAKAKFETIKSIDALVESIDPNQMVCKDDAVFLYTGGIDVDAAYRVVGKDGKSNNSIHDITFTHLSGPRPYSYGLQACNATGFILVAAWSSTMLNVLAPKTDVTTITKLYESNENL